MIIEAINRRTGKKVNIKEAYPGQRLACPYCGVDMHPVLGVENPFFRCFEGGKHTHYLCEQLERSNKAYDPNLINPDQLFANLFRPVKEPITVFPPEGGDGPEEIPEPGDPGMGPEEGPDGGPDMGPEDEDEPSEPVILPCRTLGQLWKAGIDKFGPSYRMGSCLRSDIFLWFKDFDHFFAPRKSLGERIIAVRPLWPINRANAILFASFSSIRGSDEFKKKYFVLKFEERKEYNKICRKLFALNTDKTGTSGTKPKYNMVLVAGDWAELTDTEISAFVKPGKQIYGAQISFFRSTNQVYPIPQQKIKEKR